VRSIGEIVRKILFREFVVLWESTGELVLLLHESIISVQEVANDS
jgi:hypothetical protein